MATREVKIYCPKCKWEPSQNDRWVCEVTCGHTWNTFDTGGVCPECGKSWKVTTCLSCGSRSPHRDWYHQYGNDPVEVAEEELVEIGTEGSSAERSD